MVRGQPSGIQRGPLTFWISDKLAADGTIAWEQISQDRFRKLLIAASDAFELVEQYKDQPHVTFFVHGYNVGWQASSNSYQNLCTRMFEGDDSLGLCVSFDWPSYGEKGSSLFWSARRSLNTIELLHAYTGTGRAQKASRA